MLKFFRLIVLVVLATGHKIDEEDNVPDVDIRKIDSRHEFAHFVRVSNDL